MYFLNETLIANIIDKITTNLINPVKLLNILLDYSNLDILEKQLNDFQNLKQFLENNLLNN